MLAAAAVVVAAGGVTVAVLALSSPGPTASPASQPPALGVSSHSPLATLTEPDGSAPINVAFKSDSTLVTVDASKAYSWDIATNSPTPTDFDSAQAFISTTEPAAGELSLFAGNQDNVVQAWNTSNGDLIATLAAPSGTVVNAYAISPDGTEAAVADSDGRTYVWKIAS